MYQQFAITIADFRGDLSSIKRTDPEPGHWPASLLKPPGEAKSVFEPVFSDGSNHYFEIATDKVHGLDPGISHIKSGAPAGCSSRCVGGVILLFQIVPSGFVPEEDQAYIMAGVIMPDSASLQRHQRCHEAGRRRP